jgi:hypothetical protein
MPKTVDSSIRSPERVPAFSADVAQCGFNAAPAGRGGPQVLGLRRPTRWRVQRQVVFQDNALGAESMIELLKTYCEQQWLSDSERVRKVVERLAATTERFDFEIGAADKRAAKVSELVTRYWDSYLGLPLPGPALPPEVPQQLYDHPEGLIEAFRREVQTGTLLFKGGGGDQRFAIALGRTAGSLSSNPMQTIPSATLLVDGVPMRTYSQGGTGVVYRGSRCRIHLAATGDVASSSWAGARWSDLGVKDLGTKALRELAEQYDREWATEKSKQQSMPHNEVLATLLPENLLGFYVEVNVGEQPAERATGIISLADTRSRLGVPQLPIYTFDAMNAKFELITNQDLEGHRSQLSGQTKQDKT